MTQWAPDTCNCIYEYEWDDAEPETGRTHTLKKAVKLCDAHKSLSEIPAFNAVVSENSRKNNVFAEARNLKKQSPEYAGTIWTEKEERKLTELVLEKYQWSFDASRKLIVSLDGLLTPAQKNQLQNLCNSTFGAGKIEVV